MQSFTYLLCNSITQIMSSKCHRFRASFTNYNDAERIYKSTQWMIDCQHGQTFWTSPRWLKHLMKILSVF